MTQVTNKELTRRFFEGCSAGDISVINELVSPDLIDHTTEVPDGVSAFEMLTGNVSMLKGAVSDVKFVEHHRTKSTELASPRIKAMPIDDQSYYYTVPARENQVLTAKNQVIQVISGIGWVSCGGQDYILKVGDAMTLSPQDDKVVVVSGLKGKAVRYTLKG